MSFSPSDSSIKVDAALEEKLKGASFEEIKAHLANAAVQQRLVVPDVYDNSVLIPTLLADAAPQKVAKVIILNGVKHSLVGDDDADLLAQENALYRASMQPAVTVEPEAQPRNERGQFVSADDIAAKVELELRFKRGDIDAATYLAESGAIDQYLASQGITLQDLKQNADKNYEANWEASTTTFLSRHPEWVGGQENLQRMGETLSSLGLTDSPSVESLEAAYAELRSQNRIAENPEVRAARDQDERIANARTPEELRAALGRGSASLFGR